MTFVRCEFCYGKGETKKSVMCWTCEGLGYLDVDKKERSLFDKIKELEELAPPEALD